jgi:hypothetical protein
MSITIGSQQPNLFWSPKILVVTQELTTKLWQLKIQIFNVLWANYHFFR